MEFKSSKYCDSLKRISDWIECETSRNDASLEEKAVIVVPESLKSLGFNDLVLEKAGPEIQEDIINCYDFTSQKPKAWTELNHLVTWSTEFLSLLKDSKHALATLELIRGAKEFPISSAEFHVDESMSLVRSALSFDLGLDIQHPDTRGHNYAVETILIDDSNNLHDIVKQTFTCLFCRCAVRLVVKTNLYYSSVLVAFLVDLMHQAGATSSEVRCLALDRRDSLGNDKLGRCISPNKSSKLSTISIIFKQTDTFAAAQGIIESYFREQYPNLIIMVEEPAYERFIKDWQRYYSHAVHIGSRLDTRTTVVDLMNEKIQIDLEAIDIRSAHKMAGNVINVLRYRTLNELMSLLSHLRKVPYISIWNDDVLLSREFCLRVNQCNDFWINHIPKSIAGVKFAEVMLNFYADVVADDMTLIYNSVYSQFADEAEQVRKVGLNFMKKDMRLRNMLIIQAYISMVTKSKSLKNGTTTSASIARLKRFQNNCNQKINVLEPGNSQVEISIKPVGLAIILVREENSIKSKALLLELVFKTLLLGNAVLLVCPANTLGVRFSFDNDHIIPFKMVNEPMPDISRLSLDASIEVSENSVCKKQCPKNTYAFEVLPEMTGEIFEAITMALGSRQKSIWYPDAERATYWSIE